MSGPRRDSYLPSVAQVSTGSPPDVRQLLRRYGLRPDKGLGQNFLVDPGSLRRVIEAADLTREDAVLEIGAGLGSLTSRLAAVAGRVVAVEFDRRLIPPLEETVADLANVRLVNDDILSLDLAKLMEGDAYHVVANIPYNITSTLIRHLMEAPDPSRIIVLTIQREVAERIASGPGDMSLLALSVQVYGQPSLRGDIPASAFFPRPKVDSAVLRIDAGEKPRVAQDLIDPIFRLARAGFGQKRKKLVNALASGLGVVRSDILDWLESAGVSADARAQELELESWERLASAMRDTFEA
ncbi:MAG TPA: 16S rRNA (adenine(1518)-N(6)/adenine(1519)-N(6))-dimethyltransferase RsmA [Anaerolineales bacterium]|nr:16S rRNA (adenine(1518)-N(6)/adenine(1519)-N(6))-dimethyltransferase RsmA [Anaerolineales bacterium]